MKAITVVLGCTGEYWAVLACTFYFDGFGQQELNIIAHAGSWELTPLTLLTWFTLFKQLTLLTCKPCMNAPFYAGVVRSSKIWHTMVSGNILLLLR